MLDEFVADHPRIWDSVVFVRHDEFDADFEVATFTLAFRHRSSWQDGARILIHRSELLRYVYECSVKMKVHYESAPLRRVLYYGGVLEQDQGQPQSYKKDIRTQRNDARNGSEESIGFIYPQQALQGS
jgi:hypothetical protein